ncbi:MAG: hypothetical protein K2P84_06155, partial [Undibacterium sp.]|nr:hypothetical protein [Undibacterium sp.]
MMLHNLEVERFNTSSNIFFSRDKVFGVLVVVLLHVLLFALIFTQTNTPAIKILGMKLVSVSVFERRTPTPTTVIEQSTNVNTESKRAALNAVPAVLSKPLTVAPANSQNTQVVDVSIVSAREQSITLPPLEIKGEAAKSSEALLSTEAQTLQKIDAGAKGLALESDHDITIGESDNHVIEILRMGSSRAIYSSPDFTQTTQNPVVYQIEIGEYNEIEMAVVNHLISRIRERYKKEIIWNSKVKARFVRLSMLQ